MSTKLESRRLRRVPFRLLPAASSFFLFVAVLPHLRADDVCEPTTPEVIEADLAVAEASIRAKPARAYERVKKAEGSLPCLTAVAPAALLGNLYRTKGMALLYLGNSRKAERAFKQAALLDPGTACRAAMARFGTRGRVRQGIGLCEAAVANAEGRMLLVKLEGLRGIAGLYVDGIARERQEDHVPVDLSPGRHLLQYKQEDGGFSTKWLVVPAPEDPSKNSIWLNLKKLGLAPYVEEVAAVGTLRIEGLPQGARVLLDGRVRRDLPVLRNVDVGERHLMVRTPDGMVMGATVVIEADKETVYDVATIAAGGPRRGGGGGQALRAIAAYGALGVGALTAAGSGLMMVSASNTYAEAEDAYQVYLQAEYGADFDTLYDDAESKRQSARRTQLTGMALGGAAMLALGTGTFLMVTDSGPIAWLHPYVLPLMGRHSEEKGVAMGIRVVF